MKKIKVVFFAELLVEELDGATRTMFQLIKRIDPDRFEFLFVCGVGPDKLMGFDVIKIPTLTLPINATYKMAIPALIARRLTQRLDEFQPDIIHVATPSLSGEFAVKYARKNVIPAISIYHTHFISYIDHYLKKAPFLIDFVKGKVRSGHRSFYNGCDTIYVPSESIAAELAGMGIQNYRMQIWKRGIDTKLFSPEKRDKAMLRKLTGNDHPTILFASRLVWEKNLETLFGIYNELKHLGLKFNMLVAGDGTARKACEERMPGAIFSGKVDHQQLSALYASSDIFLFPSTSETYGNVVIEAMASGVPCVIADGGGSKDHVEQGVNGFKCPAFMISDYAARIVQLLKDQALHQRIANKGLVYSKAFEWDELANTYFDDLHRLAGYGTSVIAGADNVNAPQVAS